MNNTFKNEISNIKKENKKILDNYVMNNIFKNKISNIKKENGNILKLFDNYVLNNSFKNKILNIKNEYKGLQEKINKLNEKYENIKQLNVKQNIM